MPALKVIATSSGFGDRSHTTAEALGADAIVPKPIVAERLYEAIDSVAADTAG
jgi:hypothetical protein